MLNSLLAKLGMGDGLRALLKEALAPLSAVDATLGRDTLAFVLDGADPGVLLRLPASAGVTGALLGFPGRLEIVLHNTGLYQHPSYDAVAAAVDARSRFYDAVFARADAVQILARLAKVMHAVDNGESLVTYGVAAPDWLHYLINDVVFSSRNVQNYENRDIAVPRPGWSLALLATMFAEQELSPALLIEILFETGAVGNWQPSRRLDMLSWSGSTAWLVDHAAQLRAVCGGLSALGKIDLAKAIGESAELGVACADLLITLAVSKLKTVREAAVQWLKVVPKEQRVAELGRVLRSGASAEKMQAIDLLARESDAAVLAMLEAALLAAPARALEQALRSALARLGAGVEAAQQQPAEVAPAPPPLQLPVEVPLSEAVFDLLMENLAAQRLEYEQSAEEEAELNLQEAEDDKYWGARITLQEFLRLDATSMRVLMRQLNGELPCDKPLKGIERRVLAHRDRLAQCAEMQLGHVVRALRLSGARMDRCLELPLLHYWLQRQAPDTLDLRQVAALLAGVNQDPCCLAVSLLSTWAGRGAIERLPAGVIAGLFAAYPEWLEEAIGIRPPNHFAAHDESFLLESALNVLEAFPTTPPPYVARVLELALGASNAVRFQAQDLAANIPNVAGLVIEQLGSGKQDQRLVAADWLGWLGDQSAVAPMLACLKKEKSEVVRAAMLGALEALGHDIGQYLNPATLTQEALKGLKGKLPAGLAWFPMDGLPALRWADGAQVDAAVARWWLVITFKLKEPGGNAMLERYLAALERDSASRLGLFVLRQFIYHDTRDATLEELNAYAAAEAPSRLQYYQSHGGAYAAYTLAQVHEELVRLMRMTHRSSQIASKGILALAAAAPGHELVSAVRGYMRDHHLRIAQIQAMLEAAAGSADAIVIQLLLAVSRRYRTAGIQERALELVEEIAERRDWTADQLADRTIPSAGLGDDGSLTLDYGARTFTVRLDAAMKPVLFNAEGLEVKALPEPRKDDAADSIKQAKAQWSACRKELKQVIDLQSVRLYEAMCTGRLWPAEEWRSYLQAHPVAGRLVQRLVWLPVGADGVPGAPFRPTEDGSLIDADDAEVRLAPDAQVRLAHAALLAPPQRAAWVAHLKDYQVEPLFAQFGRALPDAAELAPGRVASEARLGWLSDAYTLRSHLTKRGYQRSDAEDGGTFFKSYFKELSGAGLRVVIEFSGNTLPEDNVAAALKSLAFYALDSRSWPPEPIALATVPPVLLGEAYADYLQAASGAAFDADWAKKVPWDERGYTRA